MGGCIYGPYFIQDIPCKAFLFYPHNSSGPEKRLFGGQAGDVGIP